eukprot:8655750-Alexandrium_andersonii.AAC.1
MGCQTHANLGRQRALAVDAQTFRAFRSAMGAMSAWITESSAAEHKTKERASTVHVFDMRAVSRAR